MQFPNGVWRQDPTEAMAGVYGELRGFICAHSRCAGAPHADLRPVALEGYRLLLTCGCGVEFKRWVLPRDGDDDLLRSALLGVRELAAPSPPRGRVFSVRQMSNAYAFDPRDGLYADLREFVHVHGTCGEMRATSCRASVGVLLGVCCSCGGRFDGWLSCRWASIAKV
jgi:hypothetical protein